MSYTSNTFAMLVLLATVVLTGCQAPPSATIQDDSAAWPGTPTEDDPQTRQVTVVIALSSILPGGIVGHAGVAVDEQYWDFGPQRVDRMQRLKSFRSKAGPWWDDPQQDGQTDHSLAQVLEAMPRKVHPAGSLVVLMRVQVTDAQADAVAAFWQQAYEQMRRGDTRYRLAGRQCSNVACWSVAALINEDQTTETTLPDELRLMTPTGLYETLQGSLRHTAGPRAGEPAEITVWQLGPDGLEPWQRPVVYDALGLPHLPRTRLAIERVKHLPVALLPRQPMTNPARRIDP